MSEQNPSEGTDVSSESLEVLQSLESVREVIQQYLDRVPHIDASINRAVKEANEDSRRHFLWGLFAVGLVGLLALAVAFGCLALYFQLQESNRKSCQSGNELRSGVRRTIEIASGVPNEEQTDPNTLEILSLFEDRDCDALYG